MPAAIDEKIKRKVIQQWISGESRDKIASDLQIGGGTVSSIIANYRAGLETLDFDSIRQLALVNYFLYYAIILIIYTIISSLSIYYGDDYS